MTDKRRFPRTKTHLKASAQFNSLNSTLDCVVRDESQGGVRISCEHAGFLPDELYLQIANRGPRRPMRIMWRTFDTAGLAYIAA